MPYDPVTQRWTEEDTDVTPRLTGLLSKDNAYMKQAETVGKQQANRRGLLNSTMAVTAVEDSRIRAALPIASQEAGQAHEREIQGRSLQSSDIQQGRGIDAQRELQGREFDYQRGAQERDIASRSTMQAADLNAQQRIAEMNVAAAERNQAAGLAASLEQSYATLIASIMNNETIPAATRQAYTEHANRIRNSNLALIEQMYSIDLDWGVTPQVQTGTDAQTNTPASGVAGDTDNSGALSFSELIDASRTGARR